VLSPVCSSYLAVNGGTVTIDHMAAGLH